MKNKYSKFGIILTSLYVLGSLWIFYQSLSCGPGLCGLATIIPLTPWPQIFEGLLGLNLSKIFLVPMFFFNAWIFYIIGKKLGKLFVKQN